MVRLVRVPRVMIQMIGGQGNVGGLLVLVWSVLVHSVLVCSGLGLRDILDYLVSEYLRFHGSLNDSPGIYTYTH